MTNKTVYEGQIRDQLALRGEHSKILLRQFSSELFNNIQQALRQQGHVRLHQFGSFKLQWTKERRGRHPQTGEAILIPAHPRIVFTPAKALKQQVNEPARQPADHETFSREVPREKTPAAMPASIVAPTLDEAVRPAALNNDPAAQPSTNMKLPTMAAAIALALGGLLAFYHSPDAQPPILAQQQPATAALTGAEPSPVLAEAERPTAATDPVTTPADQHANAATDMAEAPQPTSDQQLPWFRQRPHKLTNGDSLWRLSAKHYINPFYWPHIYQANHDNIGNPNKLIIGRTITLPALQGKPGDLSTEDKRHIAEGYFQVYRYYKKHDRPYPYYALLGANKFDPAVIQDHIYEIDEQDWKDLQLASN